MRLCELRRKEVINVCTCRRLGCVTDMIFDLCCGKIEAIIVPGPCKICGILGYEAEYIIPIECIRQVGDDIILVEIKEEKCLKSCREK